MSNRGSSAGGIPGPALHKALQDPKVKDSAVFQSNEKSLGKSSTMNK